MITNLSSRQTGYVILFALTLVLGCSGNHNETSIGQGYSLDTLRLVNWRPQSQLVTKVTDVTKPRFPVIDIHNHLGNLEKMGHYISEMEKAGVIAVISLDGHSRNDFYKKHIEEAKRVSGDRVLVFFAPDWSRIDEPDFGVSEAERLQEAVSLGARGVKVFKSLGLTVKDKSGKIVPVNDPRIDPIWSKCGDLGIPVMIHVSDPKAFFTPLDHQNERFDELVDHPNWSFFGKDKDGTPFPAKEEILRQRNDVIARHPKTTFIGAHVGNLPEDLGQVGEWLDTYSNFYVDIDARISELGRQPYTARDFIIKYQDRVLFGTDTSPDYSAYKTYYRFLETRDEYIDPSRGHHLQGRWMIYGLYLPDQVLEKVYNRNARKILKLN